jgi:predicted SprT family Zn-dependent metalloprotease
VCIDFQRLFETLVHELCHAGQWLILHERAMGHGSSFRYWFATPTLSRKPRANHSHARAPITRGNLAMKAFPGLEVGMCHAYDTVSQCRYRYKCTNKLCNTIVGRHSPSLDPSSYRCKVCGGSVEMLLSK